MGSKTPGGAVYERSMVEPGEDMAAGRLTSEAAVRAYLERIAAIDHDGPRLRSVIEINPDAERIARELDAERRSTGPRSPLHGIPILLKDNIDTADGMHTAAGSLARRS